MASSFKLDDRVLTEMIRDNPDKLGKAMRGKRVRMVADMRANFGTSPSDPGDPPGVDTGALRASVDGYTSGELQETIHDGVVYGLVHEYGLGDHPTRPWFVPVFEAHRRTFADDIERAVNG